MKIIEYPYGKVTKTLKKATLFLNRNKVKIYKKLLKECNEQNSIENMRFSFDFPNYLNMPKSVCSRLNSDEVDWLQSEWHNFCESYESKITERKQT